MSKRKLSINDLKSKLQSLQDKIDREEQKLNSDIGTWVRQQTKVDSLKVLQDNFIIIPIKKTAQNCNAAEPPANTQPSNIPVGQKKTVAASSIVEPLIEKKSIFDELEKEG